MEIRVMNSVIDMWRAYNAVKEPLDKLNVKREVLGQMMGLRKFDIEQHLLNRLKDDRKESNLVYARDTIIEVVGAIQDREVTCKLYRALYDILCEVENNRMDNIRFMKITNVSEGVDGELQYAREEVEALLAEKKVREAYINLLKKRNWWQRLWNKDVDLCDINIE
jgi:hypothetical protein